jgi:hypothetical protein
LIFLENCLFPVYFIWTNEVVRLSVDIREENVTVKIKIGIEERLCGEASLLIHEALLLCFCK